MVDLKGLFWVTAKGRTYYYAWRGGPRIEAAYGTPEFHKEFAEARSPVKRLDKRKFGAWITLYKASHDYLSLSKSTRRVWELWLDRVRDEFGSLATAQFDRVQIKVAIRHWLAKWRGKPRAADMGKQVLSRVLSYAVAEGSLAKNLCFGIPNAYEANRSDIIWEKPELDVLFAHASKEVADAVKLALHTGLRQGDLMRLSWSHVQGHGIEMPTGKSRGRRKALIPVTAELRALLATIPKKATTILTNSRGKPWKAFNTSWHDTLRASKLSERDLHFHDLRGTAATNFYRAGLSIRAIAQIMGWEEEHVERIIDRYVKRDAILLDQIRLIEAGKSFENGA